MHFGSDCTHLVQHNQRSCNLWPATGSTAVGNECLALFNTPFGVCITWVSRTSKVIPVTDTSDSLKSGNLCCQARYWWTATGQVTWCGATPSQRCDFRGQFTVKCSLNLRIHGKPLLTCPSGFRVQRWRTNGRKTAEGGNFPLDPPTDSIPRLLWSIMMHLLSVCCSRENGCPLIDLGSHQCNSQGRNIKRNLMIPIKSIIRLICIKTNGLLYDRRNLHETSR